MREIKFRAWNVDSNKMDYPLVLAICNDGIMKPLINCSDGNYPEVAQRWIESCYKFEQLHPIPITEEWLLRMGFEKKKDISGFHYVINKHRVYLFDDGFEFELNLYDDERVNLFREYNYIHQLQNLYHALTGQELTINQQPGHSDKNKIQ